MEKETSRVEAFSDGVFAIALTLLILGIKVPDFTDLASNEKTLSISRKIFGRPILLLFLVFHRSLNYVDKPSWIFLNT